MSKITEEDIKRILSKSKIEVTHRVFGKTCIIAVQLPCNFVIVESSSCVNPADYDEKMGIELALGKVNDKIWELEGYKAHKYPEELESYDEASGD